MSVQNYMTEQLDKHNDDIEKCQKENEDKIKNAKKNDELEKIEFYLTVNRELGILKDGLDAWVDEVFSNLHPNPLD